MPAAMVVLIVLASIMVDFAIVRMRAAALTASAAPTTPPPRSPGPARGATWIDIDAARTVAIRSLAAYGLHLDQPPTVSVSPDGREVTVTLHATHGYLFSPAIPGAPDTFTVDVTATARAAIAGEE
jgi:hypothetical protein